MFVSVNFMGEGGGGRGVRKGGAPPHTDNAHSIPVPRLDSQVSWRKANVAF